MKRSLSKTLAMFIAIMLLISVLTACGDGDKKVDEQTPSNSENVEQEDKSNEEDGQESEQEESNAESGQTPRNETLYFSGQQWGAVNDFNPLSSNSNNAMMIAQNDAARTLVWETLFMYNQLDGKLYPLLAKEYKQEDKVFTVKMNADAKWSDGTPLTAKDVKFTFEVHRDMKTGQASMWDYIESVEAPDDETVVITAKSENYNPLKVLEVLPKMYILPEHQMTKLIEKNDKDPDKVKTDKNEDFIGSGPYKLYFTDETKIVLIRDDNYWGQAESMWGKLPAPKYIAHNVFSDNNAGSVAFQQGEVDVSQQFMPEIWKMWEEQDLPVSTYIDEPPYYECVALPTAIINVTKPGLDNVAVRKAIAMATDYDKIAKTAMSGYTPLMSEVPPSLMNPTDVEQGLINKEELKELQWKGNQIDEAKALLDEANIKDTDGDGYRELDGKKLSFKVECPAGWTDWNAALEMVAAAGKEIGIEITTYFPEATVWTEDLQTGNFDIIMYTYAGASISNPWTRCYQTLYSDGGKNKDADRVYYNYGRYSNKRADEIIDAIPTVTDEGKLKELYTELNKIYLTDVPCFALMYRPGTFHTVNESVWTGFPEKDDGTNIPPTDCTDGYGIAALYNLKNVK
jgi:peptide/nickel transport system substrate-binding protein